MTAAAASASAKLGRRRPRRPDRVPLPEGHDRRRVARDPDAALLTRCSGGGAVDTNRFSDGPHTLGHCATDFAGNVGCAAPRTVLVDNNPPAGPHTPSLAGGDGWQRTNDFDLTWANPDQGRASPIGAPTGGSPGPAASTPGSKFAPGQWVTSLADRSVPAAGAYTLHLWLRDEAGNDAASTAVEVPLRLDNVAPDGRFRGDARPRAECGVAKHDFGSHHRFPFRPEGWVDQRPAARRRQLGRAADQARAGCDLRPPGRGRAARPRAGHLPVPRRRARRRRQCCDEHPSR